MDADQHEGQPAPEPLDTLRLLPGSGQLVLVYVLGVIGLLVGGFMLFSMSGVIFGPHATIWLPYTIASLVITLFGALTFVVALATTSVRAAVRAHANEPQGRFD